MMKDLFECGSGKLTATCLLRDAAAAVSPAPGHYPVTGSTGAVAGSIGQATNGNRVTIMIVDDEPTTIEVLAAFLEDVGYTDIISTEDATQAVVMIAARRPDILLLDIMMPEIDGFTILERLRADPAFAQLPVIVLTSDTSAATKLRALGLGATDFLAKPVDPSELALRMRNTLAAKAYRDRLENFDMVTGLPNRRLFMDCLTHCLHDTDTRGAVLHVAVNDLNKVNDALGPAVADGLLREIAARFTRCLIGKAHRVSAPPAQPLIARLGAHDFAVLLESVDDIDMLATAGETLAGACSTSFFADGNEIFLSANVGVAVFPADSGDANQLLQHAGAALATARQEQRGSVRYYAPELNLRSMERLTLEADLHRAVERHEFVLYYQPRVDVASGAIAGAEALVRWQHPERGLIAPAGFIGVIEECGLMTALGTDVLRQACAQMQAWDARGCSPSTISVNVSVQQLKDAQFVATVKGVLDEFGVDPGRLQIEVTESMLMQDTAAGFALLDEIGRLGITISVDDFGTGYSSLSYLNRLPLHELKIDRSFLTDIDSDSGSRTIVAAIIAMAHGMRLKVVAEGVEKPEQLAILRALQCDEYQGYLCSRPLPAEEFARLMTPTRIVRSVAYASG